MMMLTRWVCVAVLLMTAAAKVPLVLGSGRAVGLDPVVPFLSHWQVLALAVAMETASAASLVAIGTGWRFRSWPLLGFVGCCLGYRLHLVFQGHFGCDCLGRLPRWTPWLDAEVLGMVSWALLALLATGGAMVGWADAKRMDEGRGRTP